MRYQPRLRTLSSLLACVAVVLLLAALPAPAQPAPSRPNVLFIAVDDLRPQLGCYGRPQMITPHMDRLAATGTLFERAYCQQAVCAPSRASLLTGLRPDTTQIHDLQTPLRQAMPDVVSLPRAFKDAGYTSIGLGKIYHHADDDKGIGWSENPWRPQGSQWLTAESQAAIQRRKDNAKADRAGRFLGPPYEAADVADGAYPDGQIADRALDYLQRFKDSREPFFLAVGFMKPHLPFNCPKRYWDLYDPATIPLAHNPARPEATPDLAFTAWGELRNYDGVPAQGPMPDDEARKLIHGYYASCSYTDAQVGRVLDTLDKLELAGNTIVVLWGDHGWHLGEHNQWTKHTNFENAVHAPLILRVPGTPAGQRTAALTEFVDVFPTLCELTGVEAPPELEGTSLVPLLRDPSRPWKSAAFSQFPRGRGTMGYTLRTDRYRYTRWQGQDGRVEAQELYDHQTDPDEDRNLAAMAEHASTVAELSAKLDEGWRAARPKR